METVVNADVTAKQAETAFGSTTFRAWEDMTAAERAAWESETRPVVSEQAQSIGLAVADEPAASTVAVAEPGEPSAGLGNLSGSGTWEGHPVSAAGGSGILDLDNGEVRQRLLARWELARRDPMLFLRWFVWSSDAVDRVQPMKVAPWERPHVEAIVRLWQREGRLLIKKSRQAWMTWLFDALALWDARFHDGRLIMLQGKREDDAIGDSNSGDGLLGRVKFIIEHTPGRELLYSACLMTYNRVMFPEQGSTIWAIPQGSDIIRQRTASGILTDEAAFQDEFEDAYTAALPCIGAGGWFVALSSANPGFFEQLHKDEEGAADGHTGPGRESEVLLPAREIVPGRSDVGLITRRTSTGFVAVELGMGADAVAFTPQFVERKARELGGWESWRFRKEYLRVAEAGVGRHVFDDAWLAVQRARAANPLYCMDIEPVLDERGEPVRDAVGVQVYRLVKVDGGRLRVFVPPDAPSAYLPNGAVSATRTCAVGVDVGEGVDASDSTIEVFFTDEREEAASFACNSIHPAELGRFVALVARYYNDALVCPVRKMHGITVIRSMIDAGYTRIWRHTNPAGVVEVAAHDLGWKKGESSDELLFGRWVDALQFDRCILHDADTVGQHQQYVYDEMGRICWAKVQGLPVEARQRHGDRVVAAALAYRACLDMGLYVELVMRRPEFRSWQADEDERQAKIREAMSERY